MRLLSFGTAVLLAAFATASHADTYSLFTIAGSSGSIDNIGFANGGNTAVLVNAGICPVNLYPCYGVFTPGSSLVYTSVEPSLDGGDGPADYFLNATRSSSTSSPLIVMDGASNASTTVLTGNWGSALINSFGDVLFTEYNDPTNGSLDTNILAVNDTAHAVAAVTPEPSSFALLGTGLLGISATIRRRFAWTVTR